MTCLPQAGKLYVEFGGRGSYCGHQECQTGLFGAFRFCGSFSERVGFGETGTDFRRSGKFQSNTPHLVIQNSVMFCIKLQLKMSSHGLIAIWVKIGPFVPIFVHFVDTNI